ncbi:CRP-like cAMP-activated global transcriptional regulator [Fundidesulfovibrio magnetotacticus]|uniref:CRP-like cAMP-activated global transcriptional regulator n=1 Tax=Fundidesulfovibrio magnetotacticus TaxID=2730080 RepID=A0A6V8M122_9BACT|nr:Crp/Fnr family transcriptional regulator [Fundidesulfovibrio magnetotacticus]GFK95929.1 CRP-like cAMP-activated global transcriptional regulator [Fundidesulfovibrio magnetotacticus]
MDANVEWHLAKGGFFDGLEREFEAFRALATRRLVKKNDVVFFENDRCTRCFYLDEGAVKIFRISLHGKEPTFFIRSPGEMFGLAEVVGGESRKCSAQALSDGVILEIGRDDFLGLMLGHPSMGLRVIEVLGRRIRYLTGQLENLMTCGVATRLLKLLVCLSHDEIAQARGGPAQVPVRLTQGQMASMTGSCQQTVSETLAGFEQRGLIKVGRGRITLLDIEGVFEALATESS